MAMFFLITYTSCNEEANSLKDSIIWENAEDNSVSGNAQKLENLPENYTHFFQVGNVNFDIDCSVDISQMMGSIKQYIAVPTPLNSVCVIEALGGEVPEDNSTFSPLQEPMEMQFVCDENYEYIVNSNGFLQFELVNKHNSYLTLPENFLSATYLDELISLDELSNLEASALELIKSTASKMNLNFTIDKIEEYKPCSEEQSKKFDTRFPAGENFFVISMIHELDDMPLRFATNNVRLFQDYKTNEIHSYYNDSSGYIGFRFTVSDNRICALQGSYFTFKELRDIDQILTLEEAINELKHNSSVVNQAVMNYKKSHSQSVITLSVNEISLQYVYDKYYLTQFVQQPLRVDPMWCFDSVLDSGEKIILFVNALDGRILYSKNETPTDSLPMSQPFPDSLFYNK